MVAAAPAGVVCPVRLLRQLQVSTGLEPESFIFQGFEGKFVAKSPSKTKPGKDKITYS